jgi:hypothetical protein
VIVDLAVEYQLDLAILTGRWLVPTQQVDDAQPSHAKSDLRGVEVSLVIRAPMAHGVVHAVQYRAPIVFAPIEAEEAHYSAHGWLLRPVSSEHEVIAGDRRHAARGD